MKFDEAKLNRIFTRYKKLRASEPELHIPFCKKQNTLTDAIRVAARAIDRQGKIHSHQCRIGKARLSLFADKLLAKKDQIFLARDFRTLINIVKTAKIEGVDETTFYDTSERVLTRVQKFYYIGFRTRNI